MNPTEQTSFAGLFCCIFGLRQLLPPVFRFGVQVSQVFRFLVLPWNSLLALCVSMPLSAIHIAGLMW